MNDMQKLAFEIGRQIEMEKLASTPIFRSDGKRLYHNIGGGVWASMPEGPAAEKYKKKVEKEHGWVGSTAPTSKNDHPAIRLGKAISRRLDKKNPDRPRYRSIKDFILRRPDPNYRRGAEVKKLQKFEKLAWEAKSWDYRKDPSFKAFRKDRRRVKRKEEELRKVLQRTEELYAAYNMNKGNKK